MRLSDFDFDLPNSSIALRPASPRDRAKLLFVHEGLQDKSILDLPLLLKRGDALVFNTTKVIPAELAGVRIRGEAQARIHLNLHKQLSPSSWVAFAKPAKKVLVGETLTFAHNFSAVVIKKHEAEISLEFSVSGDALRSALEAHGQIPLPPYISAQRKQDESDKSDYQTLFAQQEGSVAAPTAGLHFTPRLMEAFEEAGIEAHFVTLHVGAGTFLPVKTEDVHAHKMHAEWGEVSEETQVALKQVRERGNKVIAVGTTSLRLLESAANKPFKGETDIFITPGYKFKAIDGLLTNFHLPKSTLFMLTCALMGLDKMQEAYKHAINNQYRFYSYGDACLLLPQLTPLPSRSTS